MPQLLIVYFLRGFHLIPLRSKYSPQLPVLRHPQSNQSNAVFLLSETKFYIYTQLMAL
jgi:hypothetical protein